MRLTRRTLMNGVASLSGATMFGFLPARASEWPEADVWATLSKEVGGRLLPVPSPFEACAIGAAGEDSSAMLANLKNPFFAQRHAGATQTNGWLDAWTSVVSPYAVAANSAKDIAAAVNFARDNGVKLVVKGAGHDYLGRNCAPESLLVWTVNMRDVTFIKSFKPEGASKDVEALPAISAEAGALWVDVYQAASANGRYVQGGGCTSVGAAGGFVQGGGYGSFSKRFGSGAGGVLQYEVVTADGEILTANAHQNEDLFWALRGGGGSTFGIVTKVFYRTHDMPETMGLVQGSLKADGDLAFHQLLKLLFDFFPDHLNNPDWGEQIRVNPDNSVDIFMTWLDMSVEEAKAVWRPLLDRLAHHPDVFTTEMAYQSHPFKDLWNIDYWKETDPAFIVIDELPGAVSGHFWWKSNSGEAAAFIDAYQSRWIPLKLFENPSKLATLFLQASRFASLSLHINKGLAGVPADVMERERETAIHPAALEAGALVISATRQSGRYPDMPDHEPDIDSGREKARRISSAMDLLREATPGGGAYLNECDYFEAGWKQALYGPHYGRLLAIKHKSDPRNVFRVHHGVGSDLV